jgi:pimeloyl-ACP methyl ester carboxylesterase
MRSRAVLALLLALAAGCDPAPPVPPAAAGPPLARADGGHRLDVRFPCVDAVCAAWVYRPAGAPRPPVVVMAHGLAGTRDVALGAFAERFAAAGLAAFVFDYRGFGASGGSPRQLVDPWRQLEDWGAAFAFVRAREDLDAVRVAAWGSSLGAGHALVAAARDGAVRAVVAQAPLVDTRVEGEATFYGVGWVVRLLLEAWADLAASWLGRPPRTVPAIAPAGGFGMIVDDAAYAAFERLVEPGSTYRNAVAARSILTFDEYNPAVQAASLDAPVLLLASKSDRFAPFSAVEAFAASRPGVTIELLEGDHFDVYAPPVRERAAEVAARFLAAHLAPAAAGGRETPVAPDAGARPDASPEGSP